MVIGSMRPVLSVLVLGAGLLGDEREAAPGSERERGFGRHGSPGYRAAATIEPLPTASSAARAWESERLWSPHVDWEPAVAADRSSDWVYQLTTRYNRPGCAGCPDPAVVFRRSSDGGATWEADRYPFETGDGLADPQILVTDDGTIYAAYLQDFVPGAVFVKSEDRGESWSTPVAAIGAGPPEWSDRPILTASGDGSDVYLAFNASDSYVAASHDGGETFSQPVKTNDDGRYWFHSAGAVAPNGDVYFAVADYSQDYSGDTNIGVLRSRDGGETWTTARLDTSREAPACRWARGCYFGFLGPSAALAVDPSGALLVAYNAGRRPGKPQRLWVRASADGETWSAAKRVSRKPRRIQNAFPALAAGGTPGDFRLVWQDDRRTPDRGQARAKRWNTWYRRTRDGGRRWSRASRLSDVAGEAIYKSERGYRFPYGDYLEIAVDGGGDNHVVWGEGRSYDGNGGTWFTRGRR